jgi:homoserine kinase type II
VPVPDEIFELLGVRPARVHTFKDLPSENSSWLIESAGGTPVVLRRYHRRATKADLDYEHKVLRHLSEAGWVVPGPESELVVHAGRWYCLTRYVPGRAIGNEAPVERRRRGQDLARLHVALRGLAPRLGQRPGWRAQHEGLAIHTDIDPIACLESFAAVDPRRADWAARAAEDVRRDLDAAGARDLPTTVVHGDFAEWNVHYLDGTLAGVIDFGLTHVDSRPYELAIARTYRAPEAVDGYQAELARLGWPLSDLERDTREPIYRAFRLDMALWELEVGRRHGDYDIAMIERQLMRTGTAPSDPPPA